MRLLGSEECEHVWRSKTLTLGPFCLLLWDDPINKNMKTNMTLYRGVSLTDEQIDKYERMAKFYLPHSFQAFTSCSRNRQKAEQFGNTLFIIEVLFAFTSNISAFSKYPYEEEELIIPGAYFNVQRIEFDQKTKKRLIYLRLRQRFRGRYGQCFSYCLNNTRSVFLNFPFPFGEREYYWRVCTKFIELHIQNPEN